MNVATTSVEHLRRLLLLKEVTGEQGGFSGILAADHTCVGTYS